MQARTIVIILAAIVGIISSFARATEPAAVAPPAPAAVALHCQVPCGIYTDQLRFEAMLEDTKTIAKSIDQIADLSKKMRGGELDPDGYQPSLSLGHHQRGACVSHSRSDRSVLSGSANQVGQARVHQPADHGSQSYCRCNEN